MNVSQLLFQLAAAVDLKPRILRLPKAIPLLQTAESIRRRARGTTYAAPCWSAVSNCEKMR